uniref:Uncharacterized protein n=1 Tax=Romanomermis culicivorax TaxID=13658 RepID=A0A915I444_ROMCU
MASLPPPTTLLPPTAPTLAPGTTVATTTLLPPTASTSAPSTTIHRVQHISQDYQILQIPFNFLRISGIYIGVSLMDRQSTAGPSHYPGLCLRPPQQFSHCQHKRSPKLSIRTQQLGVQCEIQEQVQSMNMPFAALAEQVQQLISTTIASAVAHNNPITPRPLPATSSFHREEPHDIYITNDTFRETEPALA